MNSKFEVLRTPDSRFENLMDYNFNPNYIEIEGLRIHYVDEGPKDGIPILLLHGEPSWSYLYRKMIPPLVKAGFRAIAPDLLGFGRSDKLANRKDYSYQLFVDLFVSFVKQLDLNNINLFVQDWGGLIGLRVLAELPDRFSRVIAANTGLPAAKGISGWIGHTLFKFKIKRQGKVNDDDLRKNTNFITWVVYSQTIPEFNVGGIIQGATITKLSPEVIQAYDAPFPDDSYKECARIFPMLVTSQLRKNQKVWKNVLSKWTKPFLTTFSDKDPITSGGEKRFIKKIPGALKQDHVTIKDAGHFLQEDKGEELANVILNFIKKTKDQIV